jgi:hypothetical protein
MKKIKKVLGRASFILLMAAALAGCAAQGAWMKPGMTQLSYNQDRYTCMRSNTAYGSTAYVNS